MNFAICLAGQIGSGKSSVSRAISSALEWNHVSFGDFLRAEVVKRGGDPTSRKDLQDFGQLLVEADPVHFTKAVLLSVSFVPGQNIVIDGVRHVRILEAIKNVVSPSVTKLIYLALDEASRRERTAERAVGDIEHRRSTDHTVEVEAKSILRAQADIDIDASGPLKTVVNCCLANLQRWGFERDAASVARS